MIRVLSELNAAAQSSARDRVREIFFLSSVSAGTLLGDEREAFYRRWTGHYFDCHTDLILLAEREGRIIGYLTGCDRSAAASGLYDELPYYRAFDACYAAYPAHLHVNVDPDYRSAGVGADLVRRFEEICAARGCAGVHLVTAAKARNRAFYDRLGYKEVAQQRIADRDLVLLGHSLGAKD